MQEETLEKRMGERARAARERLKLTQAEVAQRLGLNASVYHRLERGEMMPSVVTVRRLAAELEVTTDELLVAEPATPKRKAPAVPEDLGLAPELLRLLDAVRGWPPARVELLTQVLRLVARSIAA